MANVKFRRGSQSALNKYLYTYTGSNAVQAEEGTFYLTNDTNRLYIGKELGTAQNSNIKAVPVNQGAIPVDTVNNLPEPSAASAASGQFYYVVSDNILCVATNGRWVQINPDTNTDNYIIERQFTTSTDTTNHKAVITDVLYNKNNMQISATEEFVGTNGFDASVEPKYVLAESYVSGIQYYTYSSGNYTPATISGFSTPNSTYYIRHGYTVTLTPTIYTISSSVTNNNLTLTVADNSSNTSSVTINAGNNVAFSESNGTITLTGTDHYADHIYAGPGNSQDGRTAYDTTGNTTGVNVGTTGFYVQVHNTNGYDAGVAINPQIRVGGDSAYYETVQFNNGVAALPIYTTTEVDNKIRLFNAMEYQGVANSATFNPAASDIKSGYVWMAGDNNVVVYGLAESYQQGTAYYTYDSTNNRYVVASPQPSSIPTPNTTYYVQMPANTGDLIIASGTEGSNGYISPSEIDWDVITSGTKFDTEPRISLDNTNYPNGFMIGKSVPGSQGTDPLGVFQVMVNSTAAGAGTYLSETAEVNGTTKVVRIIHAETNPTTTANTNYVDQNNNSTVQNRASSMGQTGQSTFDIPVPVVSYDNAGHITGITTYLYQVVDSHATIASHTLTPTVTSGVKTDATITDSFTVDGQPISGEMYMKSETINFSTMTDTNDNNKTKLVLNIEWDTFN